MVPTPGVFCCPGHALGEPSRAGLPFDCSVTDLGCRRDTWRYPGAGAGPAQTVSVAVALRKQRSERCAKPRSWSRRSEGPGRNRLSGQREG